MSEIKSVQLGKVTYHKDPGSGFWVSIDVADPVAATVTERELVHMANDYRNALREGIKRAEALVTNLSNFLECYA